MMDKIYVRLVEGRFQQLRRLVSWPLLLLFFAVVWVQVDGKPWVFFDYAQRQILLFGWQYAWQDMHILTALLVASACLMFTLSMAWGRIWCGFACPQSVWTWLFIRIETLVEGRAITRARDDQQALHGLRLFRRSIKHLLWLLLAAWTALTFTGYFLPVRSLLEQLATGSLSMPVLIWLTGITAMTYLNAGLVREKICLHACPYSRFQSVMMDDSTRKVSYDHKRGEPRRGLLAASFQGDCVDCHLCVRVCPTGIDIREGMQAACIDCGACIDVCDAVMAKIRRPAGLIRFASERQLQGLSDVLLRPRLLGYLVITLLAFSLAGWALLHKKDLVAEVQRERGALFQIAADGLVCNFYRIKLESFNRHLTHARISLTGDTDLYLYGPDQLLLDNYGDWNAIRICGYRPVSGVQQVSVQFDAGAVALTRKTTFIAP